MFELTKEIYEDLVNKCIITDVTMDFEKAKTMKLEDLITRPGVSEYIKNVYGDISVEIIDENPKEPKDDLNGSEENLDNTSSETGIENSNEPIETIVEGPIIEDTSNKIIETTTDNNSEEVVVNPTEEHSTDIVVDEVIETPKRKTKKS